jgi:hypothetical protein
VPFPPGILRASGRQLLPWDYFRFARHPTGSARSVPKAGFEGLRSSLPIFETCAGPIQDLSHGQKHLKSFDQNAVQFCNYRVKPEKRLSVYRPNRQGKIQVGHA